MADKTTGELPAVKVGELPIAPDVYDDSMLPVEMQGTAMHITGAQWKKYAIAAVKNYSDSASSSAASSMANADRAEIAMESIKNALDNLPEGDTLVINDLTTGGTSAALSAEMGKQLNQIKVPITRTVNGKPLNNDIVLTSNEVGALPASGGTLTGDLKIMKANNGRALFNKNHSATADYGTFLRDYDADGDYVHLQLRALNQLAAITYKTSSDTSEKIYNILHTGNKPSGSYTGNGDATARTIKTGGIGNVIILWSGTALWLIAGGLVLQCSNGSWSRITGAVFANGTLTLTTALAPNASASTYHYQVL